MNKPIQLKGGQVTHDRRLDRVVQFDERSRKFPIRALIGNKKPRSYTWGLTTHLDQGEEGACTGFSVAHEIAAKPCPAPATADLALKIYQRARFLDEWPGEDYDGSSVLAAMKAATEFGYFKEYRWAFGIDDVVLALGYHGPVVLGINWYTGMQDVDANGFIHVTGRRAGGHAIAATGVSIPGNAVRLSNSWGSEWGVAGNCMISIPDLTRLLKEQGEACVPVMRLKGSA